MNDIWSSRSYAKINLGLNVLRKRADGYHDIESGFVYIDWCDTLKVTQVRDHEILFLNHPDIDAKNNTLSKALHLFRHHYGLKHHYRVEVNKIIPTGAGLGGGSSNAATLLRMLNHIENRSLSTEHLLELGGMIGADVPFFLLQSTAIGYGLGSTLQPLPIQPNTWILTVYPNFESSTLQAYAFCSPSDHNDLSIERILLDTDPEDWHYLLKNDLEPSVIQQWPIIGDLKDQLYDIGAIYSSMSGSGSSVFGLFEQEFVASTAWHTLTDLGFRCNLTPPSFKPDLGIYTLNP